MPRPWFRLPSTLVLVVTAAAMLGGCATGRDRGGDPATTGSIAQGSPADVQGSVAEWTERYSARPDDRDTALRFAQALRAAERPQQAVEVLRKVMLQNPDDTVVASAYGKALAENGDFDEALKVVRSANSPRTPDWRLTSAEGAILDQIGQSGEARLRYEAALKLAPGEPSVLNNLGLSYLLANDLVHAEAVLRQAAADPRADARVRQNLALVIGLAGRFEEARRVATQDLPAQQADANIAYLKSMMSQTDTWKQLKRGDRATTVLPAGQPG